MEMGKHKTFEMRSRFFFIVCLLLSFWGCSDYDDAVLNDRMNDLEARLKKLEAACTAINNNMASLKSIVDVINGQFYITAGFKVSPISAAAKIVAEWTAAGTTEDKNVVADCTELVTRSPLLTPLSISSVSSDNETEGLVVVEINVPFDILNRSFAVSVSAKTG